MNQIKMLIIVAIICIMGSMYLNAKPLDSNDIKKYDNILQTNIELGYVEVMFIFQTACGIVNDTNAINRWEDYMPEDLGYPGDLSISSAGRYDILEDSLVSNDLNILSMEDYLARKKIILRYNNSDSEMFTSDSVLCLTNKQTFYNSDSNVLLYLSKFKNDTSTRHWKSSKFDFFAYYIYWSYIPHMPCKYSMLRDFNPSEDGNLLGYYIYQNATALLLAMDYILHDSGYALIDYKLFCKSVDTDVNLTFWNLVDKYYDQGIDTLREQVTKEFADCLRTRK